jgi:ribonuclease HII
MSSKKRTPDGWASLLPDNEDMCLAPRGGGFLAYLPQFSPDRIAGIDEAGRGCFAGPVVAAAVILPKKFDLPGLADSKILSVAEREKLAVSIGVTALAWSVGYSWPKEIDKINILQATLKAMSRAVAALRLAPAALLIDGDKTIPDNYLGARVAPQRSVIDGDALIPVISAASILAKTCRDRLMEKLDLRYPGYGFVTHKGYGTQRHQLALADFGPCRLHRLSFRGVAARSAQIEQGRLC